MPSSRSGFQSGATRRTSAEDGTGLLDRGLGGVDLGPVARGGRGPGLRAQAREPALLGREPGRGDLVGDGEQAVAGEPVGVGQTMPELPAPSCQTIGRLAAALGVALEVVLEEPRAKPGGDVVAPRVEQVASLLPGGVGARPEDRVEHGAHGRREVQRVPGVVDEDAVGRERKRVPGGRSPERQAVGAGEHARRADRQRVEGLGLARELALAGGEADVEAAECDPDRPGHELGGEGGGVRRVGLGLLLVVGRGVLALSPRRLQPCCRRSPR